MVPHTRLIYLILGLGNSLRLLLEPFFWKMEPSENDMQAVKCVAVGDG